MLYFIICIIMGMKPIVIKKKGGETMKYARHISLLTALLVLCSCASAALADAVQPLTQETQTLRIATQIWDGQPSNYDVKLYQQIEAETNVHVEWIETLSSAWPDKKNIMMASDELPDIFIGRANFTDDDLINFGKNGIFLPLQNYIADMPNFSAAMEKHPEWLSALYADDGNLYSLPYIDAANRFKTGFIPYINQNWIKSLNLDVDLTQPMTLEQFKKILIAFRDCDPNNNGKQDEIPWAVGDGGKNAYQWSASFGIIENGSHLYVDGETIRFAPVQEGYKAFVTWLHELWMEDLIDPEAFTQSDTVLNAKLKSPERIVGYLSGWRNTTWNLSDDDDAYTFALPLDTGIAPVAWPEQSTMDYVRSGFVITSNCKNVELALKWVDYLYSDDISLQMSTNYMIGEHIQKEPDGTFSQIRPLDWNREGELNLIPGNYARLMIFDEDNFERMREKPAVYIQKKPIDEVYENNNYFSDTIKLIPTYMWISSADTDEASIIRSDIDPYVQSCYARWVTTGGINEEWDEYVQTLKAMGMDELVGIYQRNYDAFLGN